MAFRVVLVENEWSIKIQLGNLLFSNEVGEEVRIPLSDISVIVLDNIKISMSTRMLCQLAENNISLVLCDREHLPIGMFNSYDNHSRMAKKIKYQISRNAEFYDKLWKEIVVAKIRNQAQTLRILKKSNEVITKLEQFALEVQNGDSTNREAHAAKIYFNELMGTTFSRGNEDLIINAALDYGYTIIRSYLARLCVGYGLNSQLGIHHKNEFNRFNLCDDLMEPIRPMVDLFAYHLMKNQKMLTAEHRHNLINFLNHLIFYNNKKMYLTSMLEEYVIGIASLIEGKKAIITYPEVAEYIGRENEV